MHFNKIAGPQQALLESTPDYQQDVYLDHMSLLDWLQVTEFEAILLFQGMIIILASILFS